MSAEQKFTYRILVIFGFTVGASLGLTLAPHWLPLLILWGVFFLYVIGAAVVAIRGESAEAGESAPTPSRESE